MITATNPTTRSVSMDLLRENVSSASLTYYELQNINAIDDNAFSGFKNLQTVYLPAKKTISIGANAFKDCEKLWNVSGMSYMINIGESAFQGTAIECSEIGTKAIGSNGNIGFMAFYGCKYIRDLTIDRVSTIGADAFAFCSGMKSLTLGDLVYTIGTRAFNKCDNLQKIHIGKNVSNLATAFSSTLNYLNEITVSAENTNYSGAGNCLIDRSDNTLILGTNSSVIPNTVQRITPNAFKGRTNLRTINIPASVSTIYKNAFDGCTKLKEVWCESETPATLKDASFANISSYAVLYVPTIEAVAAYEASDWRTYFSEIKIAKKEANGMSWGLIPYGTETDKYTLWISGINEMENYNDANSAPWSKYADKIVAVDVRSGVTHIGSNAFAGLKAVSVTLPATLVSIADNAFYNCTALKSITIPASVSTIGEYCFDYCYDLESVTFEEGSKLTTIGDYAFDDCEALKNITIPASVETIGEFCFAYCPALESVTFEEGSKLTTIRGNAFDYCEALKSIAIPASVKTIGEYCFEWCSALESVTYEEGCELTTIGGGAFQGCNALKSITIPASVEAIGMYSFALCI